MTEVREMTILQNITDDALFQKWKQDKNNLEINAEILRRQQEVTGTKCKTCGHTTDWTGPITSCGCIEWSD